MKGSVARPRSTFHAQMRRGACPATLVEQCCTRTPFVFGSPERIRRPPSEKTPIIRRELAQVPELPGGGDVLYAAGTSFLAGRLACGAQQLAARAVQADQAQVGGRRQAEHVLETILERAPAHVQLLAEFKDGDGPLAMGYGKFACLCDDRLSALRTADHRWPGTFSCAQIEKRSRYGGLQMISCGGRESGQCTRAFGEDRPQ